MNILLSLQELLMGKEEGYLLVHSILCALRGTKSSEDFFSPKITQRPTKLQLPLVIVS